MLIPLNHAPDTYDMDSVRGSHEWTFFNFAVAVYEPTSKGLLCCCDSSNGVPQWNHSFNIKTLQDGHMTSAIFWVIKWVSSFLNVSLIGPEHLQRVQQ